MRSERRAEKARRPLKPVRDVEFGNRPRRVVRLDRAENAPSFCGSCKSAKPSAFPKGAGPLWVTPYEKQISKPSEGLMRGRREPVISENKQYIEQAPVNRRLRFSPKNLLYYDIIFKGI
jgi:hypothetical protein